MRRSRGPKIRLPTTSYEERCAARDKETHTMKKFTDAELNNWRSYEEVRAEGRYNMFDPNARLLTGLSRADYGFCMDNYSALRAQANES